MQYLVYMDLLALYDKYDGDLGLLDERWAPRDSELFSAEQMSTLGEYVDQVYFLESKTLAPELRNRVAKRVAELATRIDPEVVAILKKRRS